MTDTKTKTAEALAPILSEFQSLSGQSLQAVWYLYDEGSLGELVLAFDQVQLRVVADENGDSIDIMVAKNFSTPPELGTPDGSRLDPWKDLMGKPFGWGWVTINQQGYCDGLLLSFGGIIPIVILTVAASSIKIGTITFLGAHPSVGA
jgi:hypothetical protein